MLDYIGEIYRETRNRTDMIVRLASAKTMSKIRSQSKKTSFIPVRRALIFGEGCENF